MSDEQRLESQAPQIPTIGEWFPLSCGCSMKSGDTGGSTLGVIRCKHGRQLFAPYVPGVLIESEKVIERRTHLL